MNNPVLSSEGEWDCQCLFLAFMQYLDSGDAENAVRLVTEDVRWFRQGKELVGHEAVRQVLAGRPPGRLIRHFLSNVVVTSHSRYRASSKAYYAVYAHDGAGRPRIVDGPERMGDYHAEYARGPEGWRISRLRAERLFAMAPRHRGLSESSIPS
jgi:hypothetical protein